MVAGGTIESPVTKSAPSISTSTSTSTTTPTTKTTTTHTNTTITHTTAAADVIVTHAANAVFAGHLALPAKAGFTRRQRFRWSCAVGRVVAPAGAIEGLSTVVRHSRRHMGIVGVSKGLGISFVMRERKNKRLQRSGGLNGQRGERPRTGPGRSGPTLPFRVVMPLANSPTRPYCGPNRGLLLKVSAEYHVYLLVSILIMLKRS